MPHRVRRFLDIRPGEGLPVLLTFLYIWIVVASFLLAKPIRSGLFLRPARRLRSGLRLRGGAAGAVAVRAALHAGRGPVRGAHGHRRDAGRLQPQRPAVLVSVPLSLVPPAAGHLLCLGELLRHHRPGAGVELRQLALRHPPGEAAVRPDRRRRVARRDDRGRPGAGAGRAGRRHGQPAAGAGAADRVGGGDRARRQPAHPPGRVEPARRGQSHGRSPRPGRRSSPARICGCSRASSSRSRSRRSGRRCSSAWSPRTISPAAPPTSPSSTAPFSFATGVCSFLVQLLVTGRVLRNWGVSAAILALPLAMATGNLLILLSPAFWSVLLTNGFDQGLRFSVDKATYELLYLPIAPGRPGVGQERHRHRRQSGRRCRRRGAARAADARASSCCPAWASDLRGMAAVNLVTIGIWLVAGVAGPRRSTSAPFRTASIGIGSTRSAARRR